MDEKQKVPFYKKIWFIVLSLILFFPIGLVLMWLFTDWSKRNKWIITAVVLLFAIVTNPTDEAEELAETEDEERVAAVGAQNTESSEDTEEVDAEEEKEIEEDAVEDAFVESRQSTPMTDEEQAEREESAAEYKKEQEEKEQEQAEAEEQMLEESEVEEEADEKAEEEDQTSEQEIEDTIIESLGEENIAELNITEYDGSFEVDVTFAASENFTENMIANGIRRDIVDTTLDLKEIDHYVSYLLLTATLPLTDDSGNESDGQVMSASFNGETIEELNEDNALFLYDNLENAADGFSAHPQFR